uniref:Uncharacterized protein n=1 Tax=Rhizophora mucronata TaxID=61149 RepID=A0A2P2JQ27_RHIMU
MCNLELPGDWAFILVESRKMGSLLTTKVDLEMVEKVDSGLASANAQMGSSKTPRKFMSCSL